MATFAVYQLRQNVVSCYDHLDLENLVSFVERSLSEAIWDRRRITFALNAYYIHSDIDVSEQEHQVNINL